jgi:hypothetical protein
MCTFRNTREKYLSENRAATDTELEHIKSIIQLKRLYPPQNTASDLPPSEILDSWLYQGNWRQANDSFILELLSITHIINVTDRILVDQSRQILHIPSKNGRLAELSESFHATNAFLDTCYQQGCRVLVHCERGVSRSSTIILAYLMYHKKWTVSQAFEYLLSKRPQASPNHVLLLQLIRYANELAKVNEE